MDINRDFTEMDVEQSKSLKRKRNKTFDSKLSFSDTVETNKFLFILFKMVQEHGIEEVQKNIDFNFKNIMHKPSIDIKNEISGLKLI